MRPTSKPWSWLAHTRAAADRPEFLPCPSCGQIAESVPWHPCSSLHGATFPAGAPVGSAPVRGRCLVGHVFLVPLRAPARPGDAGPFTRAPDRPGRC